MIENINTSHSSPSDPSGFISIRRRIQILFLIITLFMGTLFYQFVAQLESGAVPTITRPPGVEAFLPISALVSFKHLLITGKINDIHPSALILFLIICTTALVAKKSFCSWICPVGLLSDGLTKLHKFLFKKSLKLPKWVDLPLRSIKYVIAGFFLWSIFFKMPANALEQFIQSPYNTFADIKMLKLFTEISTTSLWVITVLVALSILIRNFWCRYLCPYGAILGILGRFSLGNIRRNESNCIQCGKCEAVCPGNISILEKATIHSLECSACQRCVETCPSKDAIGFSLFSGKIPLNQKKIALILLLLFTVGISTARLTGHWHNKVPMEAYRQYVLPKPLPSMSMSPGKISPEQMERMIKKMRALQAAQSETP